MKIFVLKDLGLGYKVWQDIEKDVYVEDRAQFLKWGHQKHDVFVWNNILMEEVGELSKAIAENRFREGSWKDIQAEAIQVATVALKIACMTKMEGKKNGT